MESKHVMVSREGPRPTSWLLASRPHAEAEVDDHPTRMECVRSSVRPFRGGLGLGEDWRACRQSSAVATADAPSVHNGDVDPLLTFFTDEAWFHLHSHISTQNNRYLATKNPHIIYEVPHHAAKEVSSICLNGDGHAVGVVTSEGREIKATLVLSNVTPYITFQKLLPPSSLPEKYRTAVADINYASPVTKINVAVNKFKFFLADPCERMNQPCLITKATIHFNCEAQKSSRLTIVLRMGITQTANRILNHWFESEPLKATLATDAMIGSMVGPDTPGSGYVLLHHMTGQINDVDSAWGFPEGGMGAVTQAMASAATSFGTHIFTGRVS
ncbi:hypothetical protein ANN_20095 [Periplaneta americana]|uniref:Amine oxidase domain-containing protein n=1 Tax=Periplaneta americana TaxID=6978 RepID=A0ABQ8SCT8_PERAM|nr:hypothetical protein ANN_20095 [Periplaneta americana]